MFESRLVRFAGAALLIFFVVTQPKEAANIAHQVGGWLKMAAVGFGQFASNLV